MESNIIGIDRTFQQNNSDKVRISIVIGNIQWNQHQTIHSDHSKCAKLRTLSKSNNHFTQSPSYRDFFDYFACTSNATRHSTIKYRTRCDIRTAQHRQSPYPHHHHQNNNNSTTYYSKYQNYFTFIPRTRSECYLWMQERELRVIACVVGDICAWIIFDKRKRDKPEKKGRNNSFTKTSMAVAYNLSYVYHIHGWMGGCCATQSSSIHCLSSPLNAKISIPTTG